MGVAPSMGPLGLDNVPFGAPQVLVLDSGVIYDDIVYRLRNQKDTVLIAAARTNDVRLFAAPHVYDEIYDRLTGHERRGITRAALIAEFEREYLPAIRFVDARRAPNHPRALPVWSVDADDGPTAELALLLAPCIVLAKDSHLVDAGFGRHDWLAHVWSARELLGLDAVLFATGQVARAAGRQIASAVRWFRKDLTAAEIFAGVLLGAGAAALLPAAAHATIDAATRRAGDLLMTAAGGVLSAGEQVTRERERHARTLQAASVVPDLHPTPEQRIARYLSLNAGLSSRIAIATATGLTIDEVSTDLSTAFVSHGTTSIALGELKPPRDSG